MIISYLDERLRRRGFQIEMLLVTEGNGKLRWKLRVGSSTINVGLILAIDQLQARKPVFTCQGRSLLSPWKDDWTSNINITVILLLLTRFAVQKMTMLGASRS